jgi:uncharacterized Ntn-hydrolase superfamily protein
MRHIIYMLAMVLLMQTTSFATWSVIAIDRATGRVSIASATCVPQGRFAGFPAKGLMDVQAVVVPGVGVAACQAGVDSTRANQMLVFTELQKGTHPDEILRLLKQDPQIERRQFGILDMTGRSTGFSGSGNSASSLSIQGRVAGTEIYFSVQGNILASDNVMHDAAEAFRKATGSLTDRVMAAMEAADAQGGDSRCTCETEPLPSAACDGKTSHVAYILMAEKGDTNGTSFNDGTYSLYISATDEDIQPNENANPVKTLRMRYDLAMRSHQ